MPIRSTPFRDDRRRHLPHFAVLTSNPVARRARAVLGCALGLTLFTVHGDTLTERWSLAPDDQRTYLTTGNNERGLALNPVSGQVLLLSRAGGPAIYVLDPADGSDGSETTGAPRTLRLDDDTGEFPIAGGTFTLNLVGASDDGAVFACNLATTLGTVRIYRWANDDIDTPVSVAFSGDPLEGIAEPGSGQDIRFGDNFAVRGSGLDTQLIQTSRNGKHLVIYTTSDGSSFSPRVFTSPALLGKAGLGVAFDADQTVWVKGAGTELQRVQIELAAGRLRVAGVVPLSIIPGSVSAIAVDPSTRRLAAVDYAAHSLRVFDITDPTGFVPIGDPLPFPTLNANGNGTAAAAVDGTHVVALDTNNGILAALLEPSVVADPPVISAQPSSTTVYVGADVSVTVSVQGTPPFTYQWSFNDAPIPGATSAQWSFTASTTNASGSYRVAVTNAAGFALSEPATVTVRAPATTGILRPLWALNPGDRPYLTTDNTQRGLAYNPATSNLLVASRSPANGIYVLNATTGDALHALRTTTADDQPLFVEGTLTLNMIGVSDDGVVYAGNLITGGSNIRFKLYRWDNDHADTIPVALEDVFELTTAERWGDTMDIRGRGAGTQILLGTRGVAPQEGRKFALLTPVDDLTFSAQLFTVDGVAGSAFGLGIAFGPGDTVFGTANGQPVVQAAFDAAAGTATLVRTYGSDRMPAAVSFLGVHAASNLLAGVALETPDNVVLYDLADLDAPALIDQQLILPEQANANGTGSVDFGDNKLFVLDTNHGLRAYAIDRSGTGPAPTVTIARTAAGLTVAWSAGTLETAAEISGPWLPSGASNPLIVDPAEARRFFRARH